MSRGDDDLPVEQTEIMTTRGERIRTARKRAKLYLKDLARLVGVANASVVSKWEIGVRNPTFSNLQKIAESTDVSISFLLGETDDPARRIRSGSERPDILSSHGKRIDPRKTSETPKKTLTKALPRAEATDRIELVGKEISHTGERIIALLQEISEKLQAPCVLPHGEEHDGAGIDSVEKKADVGSIDGLVGGFFERLDSEGVPASIIRSIEKKYGEGIVGCINEKFPTIGHVRKSLSHQDTEELEAFVERLLTRFLIEQVESALRGSRRKR